MTLLGEKRSRFASLLLGSWEDGKLVYHGRIDNSQNTANITANDLRDALDQMIAGKPVTKTGGAAFGCSIKRV